VGSRHIQNNRKLPKKAWFNKNCELSRKEYHKAKNAYNSNSNSSTKENLRSSSKEYKAQINKEYKLYHTELMKKIRNLKSSDPKKYWA
jgi:hypothetical protein